MGIKTAKNGVWLVIVDKGGYDEYLHAVFSGDDRTAALEYRDALGFGDVAWEPFMRMSKR